MTYIPKIEKGIPIPERATESKKWKFIADEMKPGDSVFVKTESHRINFRTALVRAGKRAMSLKEKNGFRVWCVGER